jgi:hypothetical protein
LIHSATMGAILQVSDDVKKYYESLRASAQK